MRQKDIEDRNSLSLKGNKKPYGAANISVMYSGYDLLSYVETVALVSNASFPGVYQF